MSQIHEILPQHAVDSLPNLDWEYLAEQLWVHSQHLIAENAYVFSGGYITYDHATQNAVVRLDALGEDRVGDSPIMELRVSYKNKDITLTQLVVHETQAYDEDTVEDWSHRTKKSYVPSAESDPEGIQLRHVVTRIFSKNEDPASFMSGLYELGLQSYLVSQRKPRQPARAIRFLMFSVNEDLT